MLKLPSRSIFYLFAIPISALAGYGYAFSLLVSNKIYDGPCHLFDINNAPDSDA